jgi:hypothetical protein
MDQSTVLLNGGVPVQVSGESHYQDTLEQICGGRTREGVEKEVLAVLKLEPDNSWDPNAVGVYVDDRQVGYLPRDAAVVYQTIGTRLDEQGKAGACRAQIRGGWERRRGDRGNFGITLDLAPPDRCLPDDF